MNKTQINYVISPNPLEAFFPAPVDSFSGIHLKVERADGCALRIFYSGVVDVDVIAIRWMSFNQRARAVQGTCNAFYFLYLCYFEMLLTSLQ